MWKRHVITQAAAVLIASVVLLAFTAPTLATPGDPTLDWGSEVNAGQCPEGKLVINVTHQVTNDIDSGLGGYWAYDNYNRHIQVWQVGTNTFCALVRYDGSFVTDDGPSPGNTDTIAAGIGGSMEGGYRATISGTLDPTPTLRTRGSIGAFDYGCDVDAGPGSCSYFDWVNTYFSSASFAFDWWGWIYITDNNGTWVNASDGNQGDIVDG